MPFDFAAIPQVQSGNNTRLRAVHAEPASQSFGTSRSSRKGVELKRKQTFTLATVKRAKKTFSFVLCKRFRKEANVFQTMHLESFLSSLAGFRRGLLLPKKTYQRP